MTSESNDQTVAAQDFAPIIATDGPTSFTGERDQFIELGHQGAMEIANGTVAITFTADSVSGTKALFSKDGRGFEEGGHLTAVIRNGIIQVRQQTDERSETLKLSHHRIEAGEQHQLSVSFGEDGLKVYLDGILAAAEPEMVQGLEENDRAFLVGASGMYRSDDEQTPRYAFEGEISQFALYDEAFDPVGMAALAGQADPAFEAAALASLDAEDLTPAFQQMHHGSDMLKALAQDYGIMHDGSLAAGTPIVAADGAFEGTDEADAILGGLNDDDIDGKGGDDVIQGYYGNDTLEGGDGDNILDGGHGEDILRGGAGDDLIISQANGREPFVAFDPDRDEGDPDGELDPETGKLYPDQPIPADDILEGGEGADTFYFQTLINAKERFIEEHTNDDGTIRWHGVAGENDDIHNHWVDEIGSDTILDFNKAEGDRIVIEGHTTEILSVTQEDANGDGVIDHSLIQLYSDQGRGGGAHNDDLLGNIRVFGDFVTEDDIFQTDKPAYGIVRDIDKLDEALKPISNGTEAIEPPVPDNLPTIDGDGGADPVFGVAGLFEFDGKRGGEVVVGHGDSLLLSEGTILFSFVADDITGRDALFSKDASGLGSGGHTTAFVEADGDLKVRLQNEERSLHLEAKGVIEEGEAYDFALTFGEEGARLYLDGEEVDAEEGFSHSWESNKEVLLIGANGWASKSGEIGRPLHHFDGSIENFTILDEQISDIQLSYIPSPDTDLFS